MYSASFTTHPNPLKTDFPFPGEVPVILNSQMLPVITIVNSQLLGGKTWYEALKYLISYAQVTTAILDLLHPRTSHFSTKSKEKI